MLKVTIKHAGGNNSFRIGYFLQALGMQRTENCYWTEIYQGKNPDAEDVTAVLNVCEKRERETPMTEWQGKILEAMGMELIANPTPTDFKERYAVAIITDNKAILHIEKDSLSKAFDLWHYLKANIPDVTIAVLRSNGKNVKLSDKVTLYTVDYNGVGFLTVGRRFFTNMQEAKEFSKMPLRDNPIKRTYTYTHAKQIIDEQDQLEAFAQRWFYLPDYE
jgi:hypothetical protein